MFLFKISACKSLWLRKYRESQSNSGKHNLQHVRLMKFCVLLLLLCVVKGFARVQTLSISNDDRPVFLISSFGYLHGFLELSVSDLSVHCTLLFALLALPQFSFFQLMVRHNFDQRELYNISFLLQKSFSSGKNRRVISCLFWIWVAFVFQQ